MNWVIMNFNFLSFATSVIDGVCAYTKPIPSTYWNKAMTGFSDDLFCHKFDVTACSPVFLNLGMKDIRYGSDICFPL